MKRQRRTFTKSQINTYLDKFNDFTGTKKDFCDIHALSIHTFTNWQRAYLKSLNNSFVELNVPAAESLTPIIKCGGFELSNFETIPQSQLIQILYSFQSVNNDPTSKH